MAAYRRPLSTHKPMSPERREHLCACLPFPQVPRSTTKKGSIVWLAFFLNDGPPSPKNHPEYHPLQYVSSRQIYPTQRTGLDKSGCIFCLPKTSYCVHKVEKVWGPSDDGVAETKNSALLPSYMWSAAYNLLPRTLDIRRLLLLRRFINRAKPNVEGIGKGNPASNFMPKTMVKSVRFCKDIIIRRFPSMGAPCLSEILWPGYANLTRVVWSVRTPCLFPSSARGHKSGDLVGKPWSHSELD